MTPGRGLHRARAIALLLGVLSFANACDSPTSPRRPTTTFLSFISETGDWIGQGESHRYGSSDGEWRAYIDTYNTLIQHISVTFTGDSVTWYLDVAAPAGQQLGPGSYPSAQRFPFEHPAKPGLSFSGSGRGCNTVAGSFEVLNLELGQNGTVDRFHVTFEQHCEGQGPALKGELAVVAK